MSNVIREGWALKLTDKWPVKEHAGWIPGVPRPTREEAEAERKSRASDPECFEVVAAVMYDDGTVVEVVR